MFALLGSAGFLLACGFLLETPLAVIYRLIERKR